MAGRTVTIGVDESTLHGTGTAIEIDRMVNGAGLVSLVGTQVTSATNWLASASDYGWTAPR